MLNIQSMELEKWVPIIGYEARYQVSNHGRVKSLQREEFMAWSGRTRIWKEKILVPCLKEGYPVIALFGVKKRGLLQYVHRLVARAFIGEIPKGYTVNHKDKDRSNSTLLNLEIITHRDNMNHALGTCRKTSKYPGVHWQAKKKSWRAMARNGKVKIHLGISKNEEEAHKFYTEYIKSIEPESNKYS
jgi:hypothetical protein